MSSSGSAFRTKWSGGGPVKLNWFVATQPGGTIQQVTQTCSAESHGQFAQTPFAAPLSRE